MSAIAFDVPHAICLAIGDRRDTAGFGSGEIVQLLFSHPINALIGTDPEIAAGVFQDLEYAAAEKPIAG